MAWQPPALRLDDYVPIIGQPEIDLLRRLADRIPGRRIVHVNSTRSGGGVAEILSRLVALQADLGLDPVWHVMTGDDAFFAVTKAFHNALQGHAVEITPEMYDAWLQTNRRQPIDCSGDVTIIHDPQPAALIERKPKGAHWVWRCHIDVSSPQGDVWRYLRPWITRYDAAIFSMDEFAQELPIREVMMHPSIDPLSEKNIELPPEEVAAVYAELGVPQNRPVLMQVSRFDRFKDPIGVIQAYRLVKRHHDCILVLAGGTATDDPEGAAVLAEVEEAAGGDPDIYILALPPRDRTINALQRGATIVFQKSLREGFGLTVSEALWKGKPVIGGSAGGIAAQVWNGHTGYLVNSIEGAAYWTRYLLEHPEVRRRMGELGRELVRSNFLITRKLRNYLTLMLVMEHGAHGLLELD